LERYEAQRGPLGGEALYNRARSLHGLGLPHLAVPLYEAALEGCAAAAGRGEAHVGRAAAHNLALLYRAAGSPALARAVLRRFATV